MSSNTVFKSWVPNWLVLVVIFLALVPIASVLGIYMSGINSAASYYGADPTDIQYSVIIFYLAIASAFPLERRFFDYFAPKPYFVACAIIYVVLNLILYSTNSIAILFIIRFLGGMLSLGFIGVIFTLIFRQFSQQRSRVLGYATFYGALFSTMPLAQILDAYVFSYYDFNVIFLIKIFMVIPGFLLLLIILKRNVNLRNTKRIPLYSVDWASFVLYASALMLLAYVLLYGHYYQWYSSGRILICSIAFVFLMLLFVFRQLKLKRPYIDFSLYKHRNFRIGMLLLIVFYFCKGDMSVINGFLNNNVNLDVYHKGYIMLFNALGIIAGVGLTARFILTGTNIRLIWVTGFLALLGFHVYMLLLLGNQAELSDLIIPLFLQGFSNGTLLLSIVIFYVTGVPSAIAFSASVSGVAFRFSSFTASMALVSYMGLNRQKVHASTFANQIQQTNDLVSARITGYKEALLNQGASALQANAGVNKMLGQALNNQSNLLFARDYYLYVSVVIVAVILAIILIPNFHYHMRKIGAKLIPF